MIHTIKILEILKNIDNILGSMAVVGKIPDLVSARAQVLRLEKDRKKKRRKRKRLNRYNSISIELD